MQSSLNHSGISRRELIKGIAIGGLSGKVGNILAATKQVEKIPVGKIEETLWRMYEINGSGLTLENAKQQAFRALKEIAQHLLKQDASLQKEEDYVKLRDRIITILQSQGYIFTISPFPLDSKSFVVTAGFYKIGKVELTNLSKIQVEGFSSFSEKAQINIVEKTLVPDIRETPHYKGARQIFNGLTMGNPITGESSILIFPQHIQSTAKRENINYQDYLEMVKMNELSQAYFSKFIPVKFHGETLESFGIPTNGNNWTFLHVQEAFSDFISLQQKGVFISEMNRILNNRSHSYIFTRAIAMAGLKLALKELNSPMMQTNKMPDGFSKEQLKVIQETVIGSYKANINEIFFHLTKKGGK